MSWTVYPVKLVLRGCFAFLWPICGRQLFLARPADMWYIDWYTLVSSTAGFFCCTIWISRPPMIVAWPAQLGHLLVGTFQTIHCMFLQCMGWSIYNPLIRHGLPVFYTNLDFAAPRFPQFCCAAGINRVNSLPLRLQWDIASWAWDVTPPAIYCTLSTYLHWYDGTVLAWCSLATGRPLHIMHLAAAIFRSPAGVTASFLLPACSFTMSNICDGTVFIY